MEYYGTHIPGPSGPPPGASEAERSIRRLQEDEMLNSDIDRLQRAGGDRAVIEEAQRREQERVHIEQEVARQQWLAAQPLPSSTAPQSVRAAPSVRSDTADTKKPPLSDDSPTIGGPSVEAGKGPLSLRSGRGDASGARSVEAESSSVSKAEGSVVKKPASPPTPNPASVASKQGQASKPQEVRPATTVKKASAKGTDDVLPVWMGVLLFALMPLLLVTAIAFVLPSYGMFLALLCIVGTTAFWWVWASTDSLTAAFISASFYLDVYFILMHRYF